MKFGYIDVVIVVIGMIALLYALIKPIESFGSDWNSSFWGPMIWTGWNYGYPNARVAPRPEKTKIYQTSLLHR